MRLPLQLPEAALRPDTIDPRLSGEEAHLARIRLRGRRIDTIAQAWGLDGSHKLIRKRIGEVLVYREGRQHYLSWARTYKAQGEMDQMRRFLVSARSQHRHAMRQLRRLRLIAAGEAPVAGKMSNAAD